jgi:hypothetical protein
VLHVVPAPFVRADMLALLKLTILAIPLSRRPRMLKDTEVLQPERNSIIGAAIPVAAHFRRPSNRVKASKARQFRLIFSENPEPSRLTGGAGWIRTPGAARASKGGIRPEFGALFGPTRSIGARESFVRLGFGSVSVLSGSLRSPRLNADHGEQLMLGIEVAESTVGRYMVRRRQPPSRVGRLSCPITRPRHTARDALAAGTSGLVGAVERRVAKL